ncbi:MAG: hypothetical protein QM820_33940 [Minicystis sp.]
MRVPVAILGVSMLWLLGAGCGEPFTIGGGGAGGTSGNAGGGGGSTVSAGGASTSSSSGGSMAPCSPTGGNGQCDAGEYCATKDCKTGICTPVPDAKGQAYEPVCGCDGVAYWNEDSAIHDGVGFIDAASCDPKTLTSCNPAVPTANHCDTKNNIYCNVRVYTSCSVAPNGICVKLPSTCEGTNQGGRECLDTGNNCKLACELIKGQKPWYAPNPACTP